MSAGEAFKHVGARLDFRQSSGHNVSGRSCFLATRLNISVASLPHFSCRHESVQNTVLPNKAACFIKRDYRMSETGCVRHMLQELNLPPLQECRKQQRLTTLYKIVKGHIPAMPPESFLTPAERNGRRIRPITFKDCNYDNPIRTDRKFETLEA